MLSSPEFSANPADNTSTVGIDLDFDQRQIDDFLAPARVKSFLLEFPPPLEDRFNRETSSTQIKTLTQMGIAGIILFNIFLLTDYILYPNLPDEFWRCVVIRLFIFTPAAALAIVVGRSTQSAPKRESAKLFVMVFTGACALAVGSLRSMESSVLTEINLLLVLAFGNLILRLRFPFAIVLNLIWIAENLVYLTRFSQLIHSYKLTCLFIFVSFAAATLLASYQMEASDRRVYLLMLREHLRNTDLAEANRDLAQLSIRDALTGLANRRQLDQRLTEMGDTRSLHETTILSIIVADIDHFKRINDVYGHLTGDRVLMLVADVLRANIRRPEDLIARFGGEEFVVILPNVAESRARLIAERLRREIRRAAIPGLQASPPIQISVSCGVATGSLDSPDTARALLEQADLALYQAKRSGRDRVCVFVPENSSQPLSN